LSDTFDKYRDVLPAIENVEQAIVSKETSGPFQITLEVIEMLKNQGEKSELVHEVFENVSETLGAHLNLTRSPNTKERTINSVAR